MPENEHNSAQADKIHDLVPELECEGGVGRFTKVATVPRADVKED